MPATSPKSPSSPKTPEKIKSGAIRKKSESPKEKTTKEGKQEKKESSIESSDKKTEKVDFTKPLWKLYKNKVVLIYKLCSECGDAMFQSKKKFHRSEGRVHLAIGFCDECLQLNLDMTDLIAPKKQ